MIMGRKHWHAEWIFIDKIQFYCLLKIDDTLPVFRGFGTSKSEARKAACNVAYDYLKTHNLINSIKTEIPSPNKSDAINQLEILSSKKEAKKSSAFKMLQYLLENDGTQ